MTEANSIDSLGVLVEVLPNWLNDGEPVTIRAEGLTAFAGATVDAHVWIVDDVDVWWHTAIALDIGPDGSGQAVRDGGLAVGRHAAAYVSDITCGDLRVPLKHVLVSIVNSPDPGADLDEVMRQYKELQDKQGALYDRAIGSPTAESLEHRALCLIEGLLTTIKLRFPGAYTTPVKDRLGDLERLGILNGLLAELDWVTRVPDEPWSSSTRSQLPMTTLIVPQIWARGLDEAAELARDVQDRVLSILGLNRNAGGSAVALVIEQRQPDGSVKYRVFPPHRPYTGNLAGGPTSGESQRQLVSEYLAIDKDPLIRLCCDLYIEALRERSVDARFLRLWSILELLSGARVRDGLQVTLASGARWPHQGTTSYAAPRVYHYLETLLFSGSVNSASLVNPATDLYEAVRAWYGRRNATGHYGRLIPGDPAQSSQGWYASAMLTTTDEWQWISAITRTVERVLRTELATSVPSLP